MSEPCLQLREAIGGYVLGALEPDEAARVRAHLATCPGCAAEYRELARLPELLDLSAGLEPAALALPPSLEERLLDEVAHEAERPRRRLGRPAWVHRPGAWRRRAAVAGGVAALAVAAVIAVVVVRDDGAGSGSEPAAPGYELALRAAPGAPGASARAGLDTVEGGTEVHLWVKGLTGDPEAIYEVRCDGDGTSASAGTFRVDRSGTAYVVLTTAARRGEYDRIRVVRRNPPPGQRAAVLEGDVGRG